MKINTQNFIWHDEDERLNPFIHVFLYVNLVFGLCFAFFAKSSGAMGTYLYELTTIQTGEVITSIWGLCAIAACILTLAAFNYRRKWLGATASMFGFGVWLFAALTYLIGGFWFGLLIAALPNVFFWGWLYFTVERYHRKHG